MQNEFLGLCEGQIFSYLTNVVTFWATHRNNWDTF